MKSFASRVEERDAMEPVWLWNLMCRIGAIRMWLKKVEPKSAGDSKVTASNLFFVWLIGSVILVALVFFTQALYQGSFELYQHFALKP